LAERNWFLEEPQSPREEENSLGKPFTDALATFSANSEQFAAAVKNAFESSFDRTNKIYAVIIHDTELYLSGINKLLAAKSIGEATEIQSELIRQYVEALPLPGTSGRNEGIAEHEEDDLAANLLRQMLNRLDKPDAHLAYIREKLKPVFENAGS
jgi:hypothetical protein